MRGAEGTASTSAVCNESTELEQEGGSRMEEIGAHGTSGGAECGECKGKARRPAAVAGVGENCMAQKMER